MAFYLYQYHSSNQNIMQTSNFAYKLDNSEQFSINTCIKYNYSKQLKCKEHDITIKLEQSSFYCLEIYLSVSMRKHLLVASVSSAETQSHTICHVTQCHLATRTMELISKPCQCVFGQGIASPHSHQNVW